MVDTTRKVEAKFEGDMKVCVRVGGEGKEWVGTCISVKTQAGVWKSVWLTEVVEDYGRGDVCVFKFSWK